MEKRKKVTDDDADEDDEEMGEDGVEMDEEGDDDDDAAECVDEEQLDDGEVRVAAPRTEDDARSVMRKTWQFLERNEENECTGKYYACQFSYKRINRLYIGRMNKVFKFDGNGSFVTGAEFFFLKQKSANFENNLIERYEQEDADTDTIPIQNIIAGPLHVEEVRHPRSEKSWVDVKDYPSIRKLFPLTTSMQLQVEIDTFIWTPHEA